MIREEAKIQFLSLDGNDIFVAGKGIELINKIFDDFESLLEKYEEPYDYDKIVSSDVGKGVGYISGHAWVGRVKANTTYEILVVEGETK